jgi:putative flippase GtrA
MDVGLDGGMAHPAGVGGVPHRTASGANAALRARRAVAEPASDVVVLRPSLGCARMSTGPRDWALRTAGTVVAGAIGWAIDVTVLWTLAVRLGVPTPIAAACGLIASAAVNFLLNRVVHGGSEAQRHREVARYGALFGLNLVVVTVSVPLIAEVLDRALADPSLDLLGAKVVVTAVLLLFNSYAYHRWVFKQAPLRHDPGIR